MPVLQDALDEYAHGAFRRVLAADNRESQALLAGALFQHERVERAERRPGPSRQRAERRRAAGRLLARESRTATAAAALQVDRGHVAALGHRGRWMLRGRGRRRDVHHRLSVLVVLLHGRRHVGAGSGVAVVLVYRRLRHPPSTVTAVRRHRHRRRGFGAVPFGRHQQLDRGPAVVQQTVRLGRVQPRQPTAVHVHYLVAHFQVAGPTNENHRFT